MPSFRVLAGLVGIILGLALAPGLCAQGPTPETGNTLFPGGAFVSYGSAFTSRPAPARQTQPALRPTFSYEGSFVFDWGFRRDFELAVFIPVETHRFRFRDLPGADSEGGSGLGDALILVKYRFLRHDSDRGTTQASFTIGPKLPTGRTNLRDVLGQLLPPGLQPGSGSTDLFLGLNGTHTGLLHIEKLVADGAFSYRLRTIGSQQMRLGNSSEARLWLSYRPYQSHSVGKEWWIGPSLTWQHNARDQQFDIPVPGSAGDTLLLGAATYFSPHPGVHLWFGMDFPVVQTSNGIVTETRRRFSFGVTKQFRLTR